MADITSSTTDSNGINRLLSNSILSLQFVDVSSSEFANPPSNFTGYSADGYYYSSGLPDPTYGSFKASWASEAEHTSATASRNLLDRFPDRLFVIATDTEVALLDADELTVWMRFTRSSSSISTPTGPVLGGTESAIVSASFSEGILYVATTNGVRVVDFTTDQARYITTSDCYYGTLLSGRNSATFYTEDEFTLLEPDLTTTFKPTASLTYSSESALIAHLPLYNDFSDVSGNEYDGTAAYSSSGSADPVLESDTPKTFSGADPHSMGFSNSSKSASDWYGSFIYVDEGPVFSFPSDQPFSFSMWVKVDSRGDSGWSTRPAMPLLTKGINGAAMQSTFSLSSDYYEYEFYLESGTGRPVFRMYNMGLSTEYVDIQASGSVPLDTWTFLSVEFIGNDNPDHPEVVNLRINGVLDPSHTITTSASFTTWSGMQQTSAPLLIGNSGEDSASISSGDWFDGNIIHVASWIAALSTAGDPHNADTFSALKTGQQDGAPATTEDAPYLQNSTCLSLDSTSIDGVSCCAIGHPDGLTSIKCENSKYVSSLTHAFTDSFDSGDWDIGTTVSDLDVISFTSTITGQGWVVGDSITVGASTGVITAVSNYSVTTATDLTASTGTTAATVTRSVKAVVADGKDLYYTHSLGKVAKESSDWYGAGGSEIDAFSATSVSYTHLRAHET